MSYIDLPPPGTRDREMFLKGAKAESELETKGMTKDARELYDCVQALAQQGRSRDEVVAWVLRVFTAEWSFRRRPRLAWRLVRG